MPEVAAGSPFTPDVVAAVRRHMNEDHRADALLICQEIGGLPEATEVTLTTLDEVGFDLVASTPAGEASVRVPWGTPPADRAAIRGEIVRLYHEACARRGVAPVAEEG